MNTNASANSSNSFKHDKKSTYFLRLNEERMAFAMSCLIDKEVVVNLENGDQIKGLFNCFDPASRGGNKAVDIALNSYSPSNGNTENNASKPMIVYGTEYHYFTSHGISKSLFKSKDPKATQLKKPTSGKFKTDTEISASKQTKVNSVLTEWKGSESVNESQLVDLDKAEGVEWDQFETNNREYGVVSTFDENLYTTSLNLNEIPDSVKERAEMLAAEIENSAETSYSRVESMLEDEDVANHEAASAPKTAKEKKKEKQTHLSKFKTKLSVHDTSHDRMYEGSQSQDKTETDKQGSGTRPKHEKQFSHQIGVNALNIEPTNAKLDSFTMGVMDKKLRHQPELDKLHDKTDSMTTSAKPDERLNQPNVQGVSSKTVLKAEPKPEPKPEPKAEPRPEPKVESKPETKVDHKPEPKSEPKVDHKPEPKADHKTDHKVDHKLEHKVEHKPEPKSQPKAEPKVEVKAEAKTEAVPETKQDSNPEADHPKKSFKFNPNASTFTPNLMTEKPPVNNREPERFSSGSSSPKTFMMKKSEFRAFKNMPRFPRLDLKGYRLTQTTRLGEQTFEERWPANGSMSYRDVLGDLTPLQLQPAMPLRAPQQMLPHNHMAHMMVPPAPHLAYPVYQPAALPMGMVQYPGQIHPRFYNGVQYPQMMPNQVMSRRNHMPNSNPQYAPMNPVPNNQYLKSRSNDFDDKSKGYSQHPKQNKK